MLDADPQERIEQADCVLGDELFEGDKKRCAQREHAVDRSRTVNIC